MIIRPTRADDVALLPNVERSAGKAFLSLPDLAWISSDNALSVERHLEFIAGGYAWVATEDAVPVGFIGAEKTRDALHIWELAVHLDFQGKGIGRALMDEAMRTAKRDGLPAVTLTTFRDVAWNEPFYRKLGFRTLADAMPARLHAILDAEVAQGLPREKRCAMMLSLQTSAGPDRTMTTSKLLRMDNVGIVVESLDVAIAFFIELGLTLDGRMMIDGEWAGRVTGVAGQRVEIAMMITPDGHSRLELSRFLEPAVVADHRSAPVNALGYLRAMFAVSDLDDTLARLRKHGAELVGEMVRYEDVYRLCYIRGPEGILIGLAEPLGDR